MINAVTIANLKDHLAQNIKSDVQQLRSDTKDRMDHLAQMRTDIQAGDLEGAKTEMLAARESQKNVVADHGTLTNLHQGIQTLHQDFVQRNQDLQSLKDAIQSGDKEAAKAAFKAVGQDTSAIYQEVKTIRHGGPTPSPTPTPVDVTA
jgi:septal ring factor EnvC (AmiA/AmiB activator)